MRPGRLRSQVPAAILLLGVALLCVALAVHGSVMGDHLMTMLGSCLAVLVAVALLFTPRVIAAPMAAPVSARGAVPPARHVGRRRGRHPPEEGTVLIC